jgi:hypothetical protein
MICNDFIALRLISPYARKQAIPLFKAVEESGLHDQAAAVFRQTSDPVLRGKLEALFEIECRKPDLVWTL